MDDNNNSLNKHTEFVRARICLRGKLVSKQQDLLLLLPLHFKWNATALGPDHPIVECSVHFNFN